MSTIAQTALLETPVTRSNEPKSASKSDERTESSLALGDSAVVVPDSGHDSIAKTRGKRKSKGTSVTESTQPTPPTKSLVDEAEPIVSPETRTKEQEQRSTSKQQQPTRTTRRRNQKSPEAVREQRKKSKVVTEVVEAQEEHEEDTSEDEMQAPVVPRTGQNRSGKPLATVEEEDLEGEEEPEAGGENEEGSKVAKVPQTAPKPHSRPSRPRAVAKMLKRSSANVKNFRKQQQQPLSATVEGVSEENQVVSGPRTSKESVPITVHRLSRLQALQFGDDDQSILYGPPPFPKRTSVNAVDVLGQACSEIIAKIVDKVDAASESARIEGTKGESKIMKKAASTFGTELESRLFDMVSYEPLGTVWGNCVTDTNAV